MEQIYFWKLHVFLLFGDFQVSSISQDDITAKGREGRGAMLASLCPEIKPKTTYSIRAKLNSHITVLAKCYWNENSREDFQTKLLWKFPMKPFSMFDAIFFLDFTFKFLAGTFSILSGKMWKRKTELRFSRHWNRECIF